MSAEVSGRAAQAIAAARSWIGTPYHHQASVRGIGADCLGLVRGVYSEVMARDAELPPPYSRDWGETNRAETLLDAARRSLEPVALTDLQPGDVLIFRLKERTIAKHAAILATRQTMIHAMEGAVASEVAFSSWWRRRLAGAFRFPD
jgi:NlpC/P60 family putative phage cell wall peptidase